MSDGENGLDEERTLLMDYNTGLPPQADDEEMERKMRGAYCLIAGLLIVPRLLAVGIVCLFCFLIMGMDTYDARLTTLNSFGTSNMDFQLGYLYIAIGIISFFVSFANAFPMIYKEQIIPPSGGNLRANMHIYKVNYVEPVTGDSQKQLPYVVMEEEGEIGEYNRANRALFHWNENGIPVALNVLAAGLIFSLPVLVLVILYVIARIWYQIAYATGGYGVGCCKHTFPFIFHTALIAPIFEVAVFFAGGRMLWLTS